MARVFISASEFEGVDGNAGMPPNQFTKCIEGLEKVGAIFTPVWRLGCKEHSFDQWSATEQPVAEAACAFLTAP